VCLSHTFCILAFRFRECPSPRRCLILCGGGVCTSRAHKVVFLVYDNPSVLDEATCEVSIRGSAYSGCGPWQRSASRTSFQRLPNGCKDRQLARPSAPSLSQEPHLAPICNTVRFYGPLPYAESASRLGTSPRNPTRVDGGLLLHQCISILRCDLTLQEGAAGERETRLYIA